jgi:hypothetical protein
MSTNGEELLGEAFGGFAEPEDLTQNGFEYGGIFEFLRTPDGWTTEPQDPPASAYPWHEAEAFPRESDTGATRAADLGRSVWTVPGPLAPGEEPERIWVRRSKAVFVLREGRDRFGVIGPINAPGHELSETVEEDSKPALGVSADASHIVFSASASDKQLWPGDGTLEGWGQSLYEYYGTAGGEPVLVGVKNEGAPPWRAQAEHLNEGSQLESDCGTEYEGMSADGSHVLFIAQHQEGCPASQPPVSELYARVEGEKTVDISEPSTADCAGCDVSESPAPAVFEGASEDGVKVFFSSDQKLFAGAHGEAGMNLYEYDFAGAPGARVSFVGREVATLPPLNNGTREKQHAAVVAKDGTRVYFQSSAGLTASANGDGETAEAGLNAGDSTLLYCYDTETGTLAFVAGAREVSEPEPFINNEEVAPFKALDTTANGGYLVFETSADLGDADASTVPQVFEYDAATGGLVRASVGQRSSAGYWCPTTERMEGYNCDGNTSADPDAARIVVGGVNSVADDGTVVFTSALALAPGAVETRQVGVGGAEAVENVYEYRDGQVYLISPDDEATPVNFQAPLRQTRLLGIDESGTDIFFISGDRLVPQDVDTQGSWYDARVEGGFPGPAGSPSCAGEACQGTGPGAPSLLSALAPPVVNGNAAPGAGSVHPTRPKTAAQLRTERLDRALRACKSKRPARTRTSCERSARKKYAAGGKTTGGRKG